MDDMYTPMSKTIGSHIRDTSVQRPWNKEGYTGHSPSPDGPRSTKQAQQSHGALLDFLESSPSPPPPTWQQTVTPRSSSGFPKSKQERVSCDRGVCSNAGREPKTERSPYAYNSRDAIEGFSGHRPVSESREKLGAAGANL